MTFKEPEDEKDRLVEVSDKSKRGDVKISFGEPSTGQSKEALAKRLNLKGEILGILVSTNAIYVKMDAKEAYRLSRDKRVLRVEQGIEGISL